MLPTGCWYDNEETLYGVPGGCDTTSVQYSVQVQNILENNCYSCHSTNSDVAGSPMETYALLKPYVDNGVFRDRITDATNPMPPAGLLPYCERATLEAWLNAGAPDN